MRKIDRLLEQVRFSLGDYNKKVSCGLITKVTEGDHKGQYRSRADLWNGKTGSLTENNYIYSYHNTIEEAITAIEEVANKHIPPKHSNNKLYDFPIIIDDIPT